MRSTHAFNFDGGEYLAAMGATWFVSYSYYRNIDSKHDNWSRVQTSSSRASTYAETTQYHIFWLEQVLMMSDRKLNTNTIGLSGRETKRMATVLLEKMNGGNR